MATGDPHSRGDEKTAELSSARSSDTTSTREELPKRIGPYAINSVLGEGGMGIVYSGSRDDGQFAQRAAIKVIKRGFDTDEVLKRFEVERQVLSALNHPNIARVYEGGSTEDGRPYFAMEYIEGTALVAYCDRNRLSTRERLELFRKVCDAVQYAHQNLIVHRDLKPSNIIVTEKGEPKLLDFGIAKLLNAPLFQAQAITGAMMRLMTPEYASPEQVRGDPVGTASDVYSLGVLLYELLTGRRPYSFASRVEQEIVRVVCEVDPERPSTAATHAASVLKSDGTTEEISAESFAKVREGEPSRLRRMLRGDVDLIVLKSLEKTARRRYQTAEQLSDDIVRYLSGMPIEARPPSAAYKASKFVRRNKAGVIASVLVLISLAAGFGATTSQWLRAEAALEIAESERVRAEEAAVLARESGDLALGLAQDLVVQLPQKLNRLSGSIEARKDVAEMAIGALQRLDTLLAEGRSDDTALTIAAAYQRLARVYDDTRNPSIGETGKAIELHTTAMGLFEALLEHDPSQTSAAIALGTGSIYLGDLAIKRGRIEDAEAHYTKAIERFDTLAKDPTLALSLTPRRASATEGLAKIASLRGDSDGALRIRRDNLAFRIRAWETVRGTASEAQRRNAQRNVSSGHIDVADSLLELGRYSEATEAYAESIRIRERLFEESPDTGREPADYAYALACGARAAELSGRADAMRDDALRAVSIMRGVLEQDAQGEQEDQRKRRYLSEILAIASRVTRSAGTADTSLADEAVAVMEPIVALAPDESQAVRLFVAARIEQAHDRIASGDWNAADTICTSALARLNDLLASGPDDRRVEFAILETLVTQAEALGIHAPTDASTSDRLRRTIDEARRVAGGLRADGPIPAPLQKMVDDLPGP